MPKNAAIEQEDGYGLQISPPNRDRLNSVINPSSPPSGLFIAGEWVETRERIPVLQKYTGETLGTIAAAGPDHLESAVAAARKAFPAFARMPAHQRSAILEKASLLLRAHQEPMAKWIAMETGKALKFARLEAERAADTFHLSSQEACRIHGETLPMDAVRSGEGLLGFWQRKPLGVIAAITPFNFPLNLVSHKVAPALAAGNTVVLKPSEVTPYSAAFLCRILEEAGLPAGCLNLVHGAGSAIGSALVEHRGTDMITFTGSAAVGKAILARAGIKRTTLELGNASPVVIAEDADLRRAAAKCALGANYCSGQVCISTQRIYAEAKIAEAFMELLLEETARLKVGDPLDEVTDVGPMISEREATRVAAWIGEAKMDGARVRHGEERKGAVHYPTVLDRVKPGMKVVDEEVFGPVVSVIPCRDFPEALRQADDSRYALQASVFTRDIERAFRAISDLGFGGIIINDTPHMRPDHIPYGGNRQSGLGREGPRFAIEEMTRIQMIQFRTAYPN